MSLRISNENCLCNRPSGVMFIEILDRRVGFPGVENLFRRWKTTDREPLELSEREILTALRERN